MPEQCQRVFLNKEVGELAFNPAFGRAFNHQQSTAMRADKYPIIDIVFLA